MNTSQTTHRSVLLDEVLEGLCPRPGGVYLDGTLGGGGHTRALLEASAPDGKVFGIDQDPDALRRTCALLEPYGDRFQALRGNFRHMEELMEGQPAPDGILLDIGVSSDQLDRPERGFSFMQDGPLDMRMNPEQGLSVLEWLQQCDEKELADTLYHWGEERQSRRIARAILQARDAGELSGTLSLASCIERAVGGRKGSRIHPATRSFQALRMAVNEEMPSLEEGLEAAMRLLKPEGRLAVISFHSLEDRCVKQCFRRHEGREESLMQGGSVWRGELPRMRSVWRKVRSATEEEAASNPRARSAKLRVIQKEPAA